MPYSYSKVAAEKRAWEINRAQNRWDLVTINPGGIWGPSLTKNSKSATIDLLLQLMDGRMKSGVPDLKMGFVDVRDVAKAHIKAANTISANGRHILVNHSITLKEMADILQPEYGKKYPIPKRVFPKWLVWLMAPTIGTSRKMISKNVGYDLQFNNLKSVKELGINYIDVKSTLFEHVEQLKSDKMLV
jgi:dihydroflavonol-4-reductase